MNNPKELYRSLLSSIPLDDEEKEDLEHYITHEDDDIVKEDLKDWVQKAYKELMNSYDDKWEEK